MTLLLESRSRNPQRIIVVMMLFLGSIIGRRTVCGFAPPMVFRSYAATTALHMRVMDDSDPELEEYKRPVVQWYPGHIAKAERLLSETLKAVDVVVEVRDARICKATSHFRVGEWCAGKPRVVVLTHMDEIPRASLRSWEQSYERLGAERWDGEVTAQVQNQAKQNLQKRDKKDNETKGSSISPVEEVLFVDAKLGTGIHNLARTILKAGRHVQERRNRRGLKDRALRVGVIGYPNVGKSALINRILNRKRARTANTPGVTRTLQWIRIRNEEYTTGATNKNHRGKEFELLDSPGVIPARMVDQDDACLLAACNCIGDAAFDNQGAASYLMEHIGALWSMGMGPMTSPGWPQSCQQRYKFDPLEGDMTGDDMLFAVADNTCRGNPEDASRKILQDFRNGRLGKICLQLAPKQETDEGHQKVLMASRRDEVELQERIRAKLAEERKQRAQIAVATAKEQGLELPPNCRQNEKQDEANEGTKEGDVGKGLFDGW